MTSLDVKWKEAVEKCKRLSEEATQEENDQSKKEKKTPVYADLMGDKFDRYQEVCLPICDNPKTSYSYTLDMEPMRDMWYDDEACGGNLTLFYMRGHRVKLTVIEEIEKTTAVDLMGLIGGNFGLFVGVSLTTIIELFEFGIFQLCRRWYRPTVNHL